MAKGIQLNRSDRPRTRLGSDQSSAHSEIIHEPSENTWAHRDFAKETSGPYRSLVSRGARWP
jgi:hypothetical protein